MAGHAAALDAYRGKVVAIHAVRGVVAASDTLAELQIEVERLGLSHDVLIDYLPREDAAGGK